MFPDVIPQGSADGSATKVDTATLQAQLSTLGFKLHAIAKVTSFLTSPPPHSDYLTSLLSLSPLDAALSHLLMTTNEAELPKAFIEGKSKASSSGFVSSLYSGSTNESLETRWIRERAVKEAGWPEQVVRACMEYAEGWDALLEALGRKLIGLDPIPVNPDDAVTEERDLARADEIEAVQSVFANATYSEKDQELVVQVPDTPLTLHLIYSPSHPYPSGTRPPPMYLTSLKTPPYVRLYLLSSLLLSMHNSEAVDSLFSVLESGSGVAFAAVEFLGDAWADAQRDGPPEVGEVMKHLLPPPPPQAAVEDSKLDVHSTRGGGGSRRSRPKTDTRSDAAILKEFEDMQRRPKFADILEQRMRLPAWGAKEDIIKMVEKNRVLIVVGETGCGKTTQRTFCQPPQLRALKSNAVSSSSIYPRCPHYVV